MYTYGSYRKIKTGVSLFWTTRYISIRVQFYNGIARFLCHSTAFLYVGLHITNSN